MSSQEQTHDNDKASSKQQLPDSAVEGLDMLAPQPAHPAAIVQRARLDPKSLTPHEVQQLQRTIGNQAVVKLLRKTEPHPVVQPKLTVGPVGDQYEQEADRVAQQVINLPSGPAPVQRQEEEEIQMAPLPTISTLQRQEEEEVGQMKAADSAGGEISTELEHSIQNARSGGQTLADDIRAPLEGSFGTNFSGVRVHTDAQADTLNRSLHARAFTTGQDIFFRQGDYNPKNAGGKELLAHELTHVVQQNGPTVQRQGLKRGADRPLTFPTTLGRPGLSVNQVASGIIQAWPAPEVNDEPAPRQPTFDMKCHDAVVYWVLRSLKMKAEDAGAALALLHQKRGPSVGWIGQALNYKSGVRLSGPGEAEVGDILFTGHANLVTHTMVVIDEDNIKGFNNFGTFGTKGGGDQYSTENFAADRFWHVVEGKAQIGGGPEASYPVYRVPVDTAQTALQQFIETIKAEKDYQSHMDVGKKKGKCFITTACVEARGLPDDCEELTLLRAFRDTYLLQKPHGQQLVEIYYQYSPLIVDAIAQQENAAEVYHHLYEVIRACVEAIKQGDNEFAYTTYGEMVIKLQQQYIPEAAIPPYIL